MAKHEYLDVTHLVVHDQLDAKGDVAVTGDTTVGGDAEVTGTATLGGLRLSDTSWDDIRFPFVGRNIDTSSGRIDYNYDELGIDFAANARYHVNEQVGMIVQMQHDWKQASTLGPHFHWLQSAAVTPNWMIEYRMYENGGVVPHFGDSASWDKAVSTPVFTYPGSGTILQISTFPDWDMTGQDTVSSFIDVKFFRDAGNDSGLFAGAEAGPAVETVKEFDVHYQRDSLGSNEEYTKGT